MNVSSINSIHPLPKNIPRSLGTLARLAVLEDELVAGSPFLRRAKKNAYTLKVEKLQNEGVETFAAKVNELFGPTIAQTYLKNGSSKKAITEEEKKRALELLERDALSLSQPNAPAVESSSGLKGPTLLVLYPRKKIKAFVLKWTDWNEIGSSRLYDCLSNYFGHPSEGLGFKVPKCCGYDLKNSSEELCADLKKIEKVAKKEPTDGQVKIEERIFGENLFEFITTKYCSPNFTFPSKLKLFKRIARIAFLDLFIGNMDRIFRFQEIASLATTSDLTPYAFEANLCNVMISWVEKNEPPSDGSSAEKSSLAQEFKVYAIDNSVDDSLIYSVDTRKSYLKFLKKAILDSGEMFLKLQTCMRERIASSVPFHIQESPHLSLEGRRRLIEKSRQFLDDLKNEEVHKAILEGFEEMFDVLKMRLLPEWQSGKSEQLKSELKEITPALLDSLEERFALLSADYSS